jgi:hypothetical protein
MSVTKCLPPRLNFHLLIRSNKIPIPVQATKSLFCQFCILSLSILVYNPVQLFHMYICSLFLNWKWQKSYLLIVSNISFSTWHFCLSFPDFGTIFYILFFIRTNVFAFSCRPIYEYLDFQAVYEALGLKEHILFPFVITNIDLRFQTAGITANHLLKVGLNNQVSKSHRTNGYYVMFMLLLILLSCKSSSWQKQK